MSQRIEMATRTYIILWGALMFSVGIYGFIIFTITRGQEVKPIEPAFLYALSAVAAMNMLLIPFLRSRLLPPTKEATSLSEDVPDGDKVQQALGRVFTASIISWALCESIALFGLMLSFISFDTRYFLVFAAASLVNFVIYRPRKELLLGAARAAG